MNSKRRGHMREYHEKRWILAKAHRGGRRGAVGQGRPAPQRWGWRNKNRAGRLAIVSGPAPNTSLALRTGMFARCFASLGIIGLQEAGGAG